MKIISLMIVLVLICAQGLFLVSFIGNSNGDMLNDFQGGVSENLPADGDYNALARGDINADSNPDIAFGGEDYGSSADTQGLYVYAGNGAGSWTPSNNGLPTDDSWGGLALGDADGDGKIELYAGNEGWGSHGGSILGVGAWEYSGGTWSQSGISSPHTTKTVNDLKLLNFTKGPGLDIALATSRQGDGGIRVYSGSGSSPITWTDNSAGLPTSSEYAGIDVRDLNNDGLPDIATVEYSNDGLHVFTQNSGGNGWTDCSATLPGGARSGSMIGVVIGDCNNDGNGDILYGTRDNGMHLLLGNGGGSSGGTAFTWTEPSEAFPSSGTSGRFPQIQLEDIDKDGDLDLLGPKAGSGLHLYLGNGNEEPGNEFKFTEVTDKGLPTSGTFYGSLYLDFDNDGDLDVAGATWGNGVQVYETSLTSSGDQIPNADAGDDFDVLTGDQVSLDGSGSNDPEDGSNIDYQWNLSEDNPEVVVLSDPNVVDPGFTAPDTPGDYTFLLQVKDTKDQWSDPDEVIVTVINRPPVADAGDDFETLTGDLVTLDGSGSNDPEDGTDIFYEWTPDGDNPALVELNDDQAMDPSFFAPDTPGDYTFALRVRDSQDEWSGPDEIIVSVINRPPAADAGVDITRTEETQVTLNGSKSSDPDGTVEHYNWTCTSHVVTLDSADSPSPTFTPDEVDTYVFTLTVQDDQGDWSLNEDTVNVTVVAKGVNLPPSGDAGTDQIVTQGDTVTLNGSGSNDLDGEIVEWEWNCTTHPSLALTNGHTSTPSFTPDSAGTYGFSLRVRDDNGSWSPEDHVNVTVNAAPMRPVAHAGADFSAETGAAVFLDGAGSHDPDGFITNYTWLCTSHTVTLDFPGSQSSPSFIPTEEGIYVFTLWVQDNDGLASTLDIVNVTTTHPQENSAPVVNITYPTGGEILSGDVTIRWTTYDPDGDAIEYMIEISRDSGATYEILQGFVPSEASGEHVWSTDSPSYPNGAYYRIRIIVQDTNATSRLSSAESGVFRVNNEPDEIEDEEEGDGDGGFIPGYSSVVGLCAFMVAGALFWRKRRI